MTNTLAKLCAWYEQQCVDGWYEDHGIKIDTLDNPGWSLKIDLEGTALNDKEFVGLEIHRTEHDWIVARKSNGKFEAFGGPRALDEMINVFLCWAE